MSPSSGYWLQAGSYYRRLLSMAFHGAWAVVGGVSTIAGLAIPLLLRLYFVGRPDTSAALVEKLNDAIWQLPLAAFGIVFGVRLVLAPFWAFVEDRRITAAPALSLEEQHRRFAERIREEKLTRALTSVAQGAQGEHRKAIEDLSAKLSKAEEELRRERDHSEEERAEQRKWRHFLRHLRRLRDFAVVRLQNNQYAIKGKPGFISPRQMPPFDDYNAIDWLGLCEKWEQATLKLLTRHSLESKLSTLGSVTIRPEADRWPAQVRKHYQEMMERLDRINALIPIVEKRAVWRDKA